jgi:2-dehydropantoate 2-reductase
MRYVIYGAGAIGGSLGATLHRSGHEVVLVARGPQLETLRTRGLTLQTPHGDVHTAPTTLGSVREARIGREDVVVMAMKSQDTASALLELREVCDPEVAIVCAQNGVENERLALRLFGNVYGAFVYVTAQNLQPGLVQLFSAPSHGVIDLGRAPSGLDERAAAIASDLESGGFASRVHEHIMRWKYAKLLSNLANAVEALLGPKAAGGEIVRAARAEALTCYRAEGIAYVSGEALSRRVADKEFVLPVNGHARCGGSSWQSLARATGRIETDYLNGEIVLLGRLHGVPTPVNEALCVLAAQMARGGSPPGSVGRDELEEQIAACGAAR